MTDSGPPRGGCGRGCTLFAGHDTTGAPGGTGATHGASGGSLTAHMHQMTPAPVHRTLVARIVLLRRCRARAWVCCLCTL